jgi:hypothetical protein
MIIDRDNKRSAAGDLGVKGYGQNSAIVLVKPGLPVNFDRIDGEIRLQFEFKSIETGRCHPGMDIYPARDSCGLAGDIKVKEIEPNIIGVIPGLPAFSRLNPLFLCAMNAAGMIPVIIMVVNYLSYCGVL